MPDDNNRESGARKLKAADRGHQDFSQDAAENRKPPLGMGLTEKLGQERSEIDKSDLRDSPEHDARGQSEKHHKGGTHDGTSDASPRVLSSNDAIQLDKPK